MPRFRVFVTASVDAEHGCNCDLCLAEEHKCVKLAFDDVVTATDAGHAEALALAHLEANVEAPSGYFLHRDSLRFTVHYVTPLTDPRASGYQMLPGLEG
jgi:hypothetical protein